MPPHTPNMRRSSRTATALEPATLTNFRALAEHGNGQIEQMLEEKRTVAVERRTQAALITKDKLVATQHELGIALRALQAERSEHASTKEVADVSMKELVKAKKRGGQLLEEMGSAQRALKAAEFCHKAELDASKRKAQFFERKTDELEAKLVEVQNEVQRLKAQQAQQAQAATSAFENDEAFEAALAGLPPTPYFPPTPLRSQSTPSPAADVSYLEPPSLFDADSPNFEAALSQVNF